MKSRMTFDPKTGNLDIPDDILNEMTCCVMCQKPAAWKKNDCGRMVQACEEHFEEVSKQQEGFINNIMKNMEKMKMNL